MSFRGSILGVGTDIAGSIRIPALCCGVYGFKPTADRVPFGGQVSGVVEGLPGLKPAAGPLAHSVADLRLFMSSIIGEGKDWEYDQTAVAMPWHGHVRANSGRNGGLTIGILAEDKHFPLHPPVKRALGRAVEALMRTGHRIVHIDNQGKDELSVAYASRLAFQYFTYSPHEDHISTSGEPLVNSVAKFASPMFSGTWPVKQALNPWQKIQQLHLARQQVNDAWRRAWVDQKLDVLLAPGSQSTAVTYDTYGWPPYTVIWNLLDVSHDHPVFSLSRYSWSLIGLPSIPLALFRSARRPGQLIRKSWRQAIKYNQIVSDALALGQFQLISNIASDHPDEVDDAPCALQIITPRFQDEKCLWAADIIDQAIRQ